MTTAVRNLNRFIRGLTNNLPNRLEVWRSGFKISRHYCRTSVRPYVRLSHSRQVVELTFICVTGTLTTSSSLMSMSWKPPPNSPLSIQILPFPTFPSSGPIFLDRALANIPPLVAPVLETWRKNFVKILARCLVLGY